MPSLVDQLLALAELFADVATLDPIAPLVLAAGVLITAFSVGFVGALALGAILEATLQPFE